MNRFELMIFDWLMFKNTKNKEQAHSLTHQTQTYKHTKIIKITHYPAIMSKPYQTINALIDHAKVKKEQFFNSTLNYTLPVQNIETSLIVLFFENLGIKKTPSEWVNLFKDQNQHSQAVYRDKTTSNESFDTFLSNWFDTQEACAKWNESLEKWSIQMVTEIQDGTLYCWMQKTQTTIDSDKVIEHGHIDFDLTLSDDESTVDAPMEIVVSTSNDCDENNINNITNIPSFIHFLNLHKTFSGYTSNKWINMYKDWITFHQKANSQMNNVDTNFEIEKVERIFLCHENIVQFNETELKPKYKLKICCNKDTTKTSLSLTSSGLLYRVEELTSADITEDQTTIAYFLKLHISEMYTLNDWLTKYKNYLTNVSIHKNDLENYFSKAEQIFQNSIQVKQYNDIDLLPKYYIKMVHIENGNKYAVQNLLSTIKIPSIEEIEQLTVPQLHELINDLKICIQKLFITKRTYRMTFAMLIHRLSSLISSNNNQFIEYQNCLHLTFHAIDVSKITNFLWKLHFDNKLTSKQYFQAIKMSEKVLLKLSQLFNSGKIDDTDIHSVSTYYVSTKPRPNSGDVKSFIKNLKFQKMASSMSENLLLASSVLSEMKQPVELEIVPVIVPKTFEELENELQSTKRELERIEESIEKKKRCLGVLNKKHVVLELINNLSNKQNAIQMYSTIEQSLKELVLKTNCTA